MAIETTIETQTLTFRSVATTVSGEFAENMTYPASAQVTLIKAHWDEVRLLLESLPSSVLTIDMILDGQDDFFSDEGDEVDPALLEDCPQFHCYRFHRYGEISAFTFTFYLVLVSKFHETYVEYELVMDSEQEGV